MLQLHKRLAMTFQKRLKFFLILLLSSCHYIPTTTLLQQSIYVPWIEGDDGTLTKAIIEELQKEGFTIQNNAPNLLIVKKVVSEGPLTYTIDTDNASTPMDRLVPNGHVLSMELSYQLKPQSDELYKVQSSIPFAFAPPNVLQDAATEGERSVEYSLGQFVTQDEARKQADQALSNRVARSLVLDLLFILANQS